MTKFTVCQVSPRRGPWTAGLQCHPCLHIGDNVVSRESHRCQLLQVLEVREGLGELSREFVAPASCSLSKRWRRNLLLCLWWQMDTQSHSLLHFQTASITPKFS